MNEIINEITISGSDRVMGNIYMPSKVGDATITWTSSNPSVISDKECGKAAGVVNRLAEDTKVTLTATINLNGETKTFEQELLVVKAPKEVTEDDYEGYLFGHFIGEAEGHEEQIYFAVSDDGLNFKDMNNGKPVLVSEVGEKGVRDPYLCRSKEGDRFFLIATDLSIYNRGGWFQNEQGYYDASTTGSHNLVLWTSEDLVNWGEPRLLPIAPANAGMAWAPEMVYDDESGEYIIFFASSIMNPETKYKAKPNAIYYVATRDFVHFSNTEIFIDNQCDPDGKPREIIDTTVIKIGEYYYAASKDGDNAEANGGIRIHRNKNLLDKDGWEKVLDLDELGLNLEGLKIDVLDNSSLEGPELFQYNKKDWTNPDVPEYGLMADQYNVSGGYLPLKTTDITDVTNARNSWKVLEASEYSFDYLKKRHGTILRITRDEVERLKKAY
ncbi:MAG: glycoside hydrolase family 43 protein [Clostridia bacterium]|nr:glycoside hydrolase family 43 protein [Clostridia bacterium]